MDYKIKSVKLSAISRFFKPQEVFGYCKSCPNFQQNWSCPPHAFDTEKYANRYDKINIIGVKIRTNADQSKEESLAQYNEKRSSFNRKLLKIEAKYQDSKVLYSGNCDYCETCNKQISSACANIDKMRHSLESLGYDVAGICEEVLDENLKWATDSPPEYFFSVLAVLTNEEISPKKIIAILE